MDASRNTVREPNILNARGRSGDIEQSIRVRFL